MYAHLWVGGHANPAPDEYVEFVVAREFGKWPSEVEREPAREIYRILMMMQVEADVRAEERKTRGF